MDCTCLGLSLFFFTREFANTALRTFCPCLRFVTPSDKWVKNLGQCQFKYKSKGQNRGRRKAANLITSERPSAFCLFSPSLPLSCHIRVPRWHRLFRMLPFRRAAMRSTRNNQCRTRGRMKRCSFLLRPLSPPDCFPLKSLSLVLSLPPC